MKDLYNSYTRSDRNWGIAIIALSTILSIFTVYDQIFNRVGLKFIWDEQLRFQRWVMEGTSFNPWQYRVFVPYLIEGVREIIIGLGHKASYAIVFFVLRFVQNFLIFVLTALYLRRFSIRRLHTTLALVILAWGFTYSGYQSHLGFDTYFDILFYLLAAFFLLVDKLTWIIPLSVFVALNRETGIFIPLIVMASGMKLRPKLSIEKEHLRVGLTSLAIIVLIVVSIRLLYGPRPFLTITTPGWDLFIRNVTSLDTYFYLFATFSVVPVIALVRYKCWPQFILRIFWLMTPVWILVHLFMGVAHETRLFLVPYVLVFLPGAFVNCTEDLDGGTTNLRLEAEDG